MSDNAVRTVMPSGAVAGARFRPLIMIGTLAGTLALLFWLLFAPSSPVYARITPPHTPDVTLTGQTPLQQFGFSVASAGDINGDSFHDIVVGADLGNKIFVYTGSPTGLATTTFFSDTGLGGEDLGWSVAGGGDVNNDGVDDFVAGAPGSLTGSAYVYFGSSVGLPTRGATLTGELNGDKFGWSVAIIGDVNSDGIADVAVGASEQGLSSTGRVYIYHGPVFGNSIPSLTLTGEGDLDNFGTSVAGAGDVNGDGIDDLVVGAPKNEEGGIEAGKAYVFYGSPTGVSQGDFTAVTGSINDKLGTSVQGAGDVNGDGFDDVIIGVDAFNPASSALGRIEVYPGGPNGLVTTTTLFTAFGENDDDHFGFAVAGSGDLDGDGFADFAASAYEGDVNSIISNTNEGKAYGFVACTDGAISPSLIFSATGEAQADAYGRSLAIVRDVNGDGLDDLVVGAYGAKNSVPLPTGKVYAYYGVEGGCRPALVVTKTVGLAAFPAIHTNASVITVPVDTVVAYTYTVRNTGNVTLTQHTVVDDKLGTVAQTAHTLVPGADVAIVITSSVNQAPGVNVTNIATWTGSISITSPSGVTTPTNRTLSTVAVASAQVNISSPTTDQDGDTIPDNVEGSADVDGDGLPNYLDTNADNDELDDIDEAGPDPTNPVDGDDNGIPSYLDPDEATPTEVAVGGLSIVAPARALRNQSVTFSAVITAGTNVSYTWNFGDGETGTGQTTSHTYDDLGLYVVTLTASNALGELETEKAIIIDFGVFLPRIITIGIFQQD